MRLFVTDLPDGGWCELTDGVTLVPVSPRQDVRALGRDVLLRLATPAHQLS